MTSPSIRILPTHYDNIKHIQKTGIMNASIRYPSWEDRIYQVQLFPDQLTLIMALAMMALVMMELIIMALVMMVVMITLQGQPRCFVLQVASDGLKPKDIVLGAQIDLR